MNASETRVPDLRQSSVVTLAVTSRGRRTGASPSAWPGDRSTAGFGE